MFPKRAVQLLGCKGGRDCQDGDGSACEVNDTGTVKVTGRDRTVHVLEAVRYVPEAWYNLISIKVLDDEGCWTKCNKASSQSAKETVKSWKERSVESYTSRRKETQFEMEFQG